MLAGPAAAISAELSSTALQVDGFNGLDASRLAFTAFNADPVAPLFQLDVLQGFVEVDRMGRTASGPNGLDRAENTEQVASGAFAVSIDSVRQGPRIDFWTESGADISGTSTGQVEIGVNSAGSWEQSRAVSRHRGIATMAGPSLVSVSSAGDGVSIEGSFTIWFWNVDITVRVSDDEVLDIWSGDEGGMPDLSNPPQVIADAQQQAVIIVENGTLNLQGIGFETFYAEPETMALDGNLTLVNALPIRGTDKSGNFSILGQSVVEFLEINSEAMKFHVSNETLSIPSPSMPPIEQDTGDPGTQTVAPTQTGSPNEWIISGTLLVIGILALALTAFWQRLRVERAIQDARDATAYGVYDLASAKARVAMRGPHRVEAFIILVTALLRSESIVDAKRLMDSRAAKRLPAGLGQYMWATIEAKQGRTKAAADHLGNAIEADPSLGGQAEASELLAPILYLVQQQPLDDAGAYS